MELILKINSVGDYHTEYQDGDIIEAFSNTRIQYCHAEMICRPTNFPLNTSGLRDRETLLEKFLERTSKYRFTRISDNEVIRFNLLTEEEETLGLTPNADGEAINVSQFISRARRKNNHEIFGSIHGEEVWYGGDSGRDGSIIEGVWNDIETHSDNLKDDHSNWPLTDTEKKHFLPLNCVGFRGGLVKEISGPTATLRRGQVYTDGPEPTLVAKRQWRVPYWDLTSELSIDLDDVRNLNKEVDARSSAPPTERNHMDDINVDKIEAGIVTI